MRVLFIAHSFPRAPADVPGAFLLRLAVALQHRGIAVDVLAPSAPGLTATATLEGVRVHRFRYAPASWETLAYVGTMAEQVHTSWRARAALAGMVLGARRALQARMRGGGYDLVHAHWWFPLGLAAALAPRARPLVVTMHGSDVRLAGAGNAAPRLFRFVARRTTALTAVSTWLAASARALIGDADVAVAPMPVDTELFTSGPAAARRGILFVGRLNAQKGARDLVVALRDTPHATLDVVGDGPDRAALEHLAVELSVGTRIRWHGALSQERLAPMYRAAAAVAVPSRNEGLGLVAVEALLSGTPVVAYRSGGLADIVDPGVTGHLVEPGNISALAAALGELTASSTERHRMGDAGRTRMLARFAPAAAAERYADIYARALA